MAEINKHHFLGDQKNRHIHISKKYNKSNYRKLWSEFFLALEPLQHLQVRQNLFYFC